jgi:uncharacterized membrane protein
MKIWKSKIWLPVDIVLLKWSSILFGMIVGSYCAPFIREHLWAFIVAVLLLAIRPTASYLRAPSAGDALVRS